MSSKVRSIPPQQNISTKFVPLIAWICILIIALITAKNILRMKTQLYSINQLQSRKSAENVSKIQIVDVTMTIND